MQNVFIICPKAETERRAMLVERFAGVGCAVNFIDAVMGDTLTDADKRPFLQSQYYSRYVRPQNGLGCRLSHEKIWRMLATGAAGYCFIFEDDALPVPEVAHHVESVLKKLVELEAVATKEPTIISLFNSHPHRPQACIRKLDSHFNLAVVKFNTHTSVAYMMNKAAAQKLLNDRYRYVLGTDRFLYNWGLNGCDVMHLNKSLFQEEGRLSTLHPNARAHWANDRWYHKLSRFWWRGYPGLMKRLYFRAYVRRLRVRFD